jgi:ABC-type uncharacterized transport system ATPase component
VAAQLQRHALDHADLLESSTGKDIVVALGSTGAGKSTLINVLAGNELKVARFGLLELADPECPNSAAIGPGAISATLLPK